MPFLILSYIGHLSWVLCRNSGWASMLGRDGAWWSTAIILNDVKFTEVFHRNQSKPPRLHTRKRQLPNRRIYPFQRAFVVAGREGFVAERAILRRFEHSQGICLMREKQCSSVKFRTVGLGRVISQWGKDLTLTLRLILTVFKDLLAIFTPTFTSSILATLWLSTKSHILWRGGRTPRSLQIS